MSPEQVMASKNVTPAADQYAVGTTIFEALTGENPFVADTLNAFIIAKATQSPRDLHTLRPDLEPEFCAVIMRTLARAPEDRFPTLTALREALAMWRGGSLQGTTGVGPSTPGAPTAQQIRSEVGTRDVVPLAPAQLTQPNGTPATTPLAPGRLSAMTCWPQASCSFWPIIRARMSVEPPGVNGTMMRIGFSG
jgi:serine/threonine protein kinase